MESDLKGCRMYMIYQVGKERCITLYLKLKSYRLAWDWTSEAFHSEIECFGLHISTSKLF